MKRILPMIVAALVGVGAYFIFVHEPSNSVSQSVELIAPAEAVATEVADNADGDAEVDTSTIPDMMIGNPDAKVTVIEYASYTCPHCASFHAGTFKDLKKNYIDTDKINFVFREVYFDRYGLWASMIARCAGPEKFFGLTDLMFQSQSSWTRAGEPAAIIDELRKLGRLAGIDGETLEVCLNDNEKAKTLIAWYQEKAGADNIDSTPSFIINGKKHTNMSFAEMSEIIDAELE
jgi:protein-disulfide isomerase